MAEQRSISIQANIDRFNFLRKEINIPDTRENYYERKRGYAKRQLQIEEFKALRQEISDYWNKTDPMRFATREFPVQPMTCGSVLSSESEAVINSLRADLAKFDLREGQRIRLTATFKGYTWYSGADYYVIRDQYNKLIICEWEYKEYNEPIVNYFLKFGIEIFPLRV